MDALNKFFKKLNQSPLAHCESPKGLKRGPPLPLERKPDHQSQALEKGKRIMTSSMEENNVKVAKSEKEGANKIQEEKVPAVEQRPKEQERSMGRMKRDLAGHLSRLSDELYVISKENQRITASMTIRKVAALDQQYQQLKKELQGLQHRPLPPLLRPPCRNPPF